MYTPTCFINQGHKSLLTPVPACAGVLYYSPSIFRSIPVFSIKQFISRLPPLTTAIIALSVGIALWSGLMWSFIGIDSDTGLSVIYAIKPLLFTDVFPDTGIQAALGGDFWRFLTPIFLHFGLAHIVFNMLWMWQLGGPLERRLGSTELLTLVVVVGTLSNLAQYYFEPQSLFGGMSGVVYALLGYFWIQGKFNPRFGMVLHQPVVIMMLVWFVICWLGVVGNIANMAHTAGLFLGMAWGFVSARLQHP